MADMAEEREEEQQDEEKIQLVPPEEELKLRNAIGKLIGNATAPVSTKVVDLKTRQSGPLPFESANDSRVRLISVDKIHFGPFQLRESVDQSELGHLVSSIAEKGVIQPLVVRRGEDADQFELVAGERRLRASRIAGLREVPCSVEELSDRETLEIAIIENLQREDLNAIEEALSFQRLSSEFSVNQTQIGKLVGKSRVAVSNTLRLLNLPAEIVEMIRGDELTAGHGRALLALEEERLQLRFARKTIEGALSVRALENAIARYLEGSEEAEEDPELEAERSRIERLRNRVSDLLGFEVALSLDPQGRKRLGITFPSEAAWKRFLSRIRE